MIQLGLENFLGAYQELDHWLLVVNLDGSLLPFRQLRVRASELKTAGLPGSRLLIIENEPCLHQLPDAQGTMAVLGAEFDLNWTESLWLASKRVVYRGEIRLYIGSAHHGYSSDDLDDVGIKSTENEWLRMALLGNIRSWYLLRSSHVSLSSRSLFNAKHNGNPYPIAKSPSNRVNAPCAKVLGILHQFVLEHFGHKHQRMDCARIA